MDKFMTKVVGICLGLAMAVGTGVAVAAGIKKATPVYAGTGATYTVTPSNLSGWSSTQVAQSGTSGVFTLEASKSGNTGGGANNTQIRIYSGATFTLSCSSGNMTQAVFTCTATGDNSNGPQKLSGTGYTGGSSYTGTWTGDASSFSLSASAQCRVTQIEITYDDGQTGTKLTAPSPVYDSANNQITWTAISNASSYDLTVDDGSAVHNATSPYSLGSLASGAAHTVTITAIGDGTTYLNSDAGSVTFAILAHAGTQADPYTVADARAAIDDTTGSITLTNVYATGIVSAITTAYDSTYGNVSFDISDDGETASNQLRGYRTVGTTNYPINSADSVQVGDTVILYGSLTKYNSTYEFAQGNQLVYLSRPEAAALVSIEISGSMTKTSYTTAESWDPSGLTVTAYYDDSTDDDVTSSVVWSYSDATPAAMGADGNPQTLTITATFGEETDSTTASVTVSVPSYTNTYNLGGEYHIYVANSSDNTDGAWINDGSEKNSKGAPYGVSSENDAGVYTLTLVGDDTFTITLGTDYLYSIADNNGIRLASNPSNGTENWIVTKSGDYYYFNNQVQTTRYLSYYSSGNDIRSYANTNTANVTLSVPKVISGFSVYSTGANKNVLKGTTFNAVAAAAAGFQARLNYTDSTYDDVTNDATWSLDTSTVGTATLTVTYSTYDAVTFTDMNIYTAVITSLTIDSSSAKTTYLEGETLNLEGLVITGHDSSSNDYALEIEDCTFSPTSGATLSTSNTSVTVTYTNDNSSTASSSYSITVNAFVGYTKVTNADDLVIGDSYVIGVENTNKCYELMSSASSSTTTAYRTRVDGTDAFNDAKTSVTQSGASTAGAVVVTLLSDGNGKYALYDITNDKYIAGNSSSNYAPDYDSLSSAGESAWWTISFADGLMSMTLNNSTRVFGFNLGSPRFSTYASYASNSTTVSSGTAHPVLFRMSGSSVKTSATSFANTSLKMNDSAYEGDIETENCASNYVAMKTAYTALSDAVKNVFQYSSDYAAARARLNNWATANGETFTYGADTPFAQASAKVLPAIINESGTTVSIIVIISMVSLTAIGGYFFLKRRKETN